MSLLGEILTKKSFPVVVVVHKVIIVSVRVLYVGFSISLVFGFLVFGFSGFGFSGFWFSGFGFSGLGFLGFGFSGFGFSGFLDRTGRQVFRMGRDGTQSSTISY